MSRASGPVWLFCAAFFGCAGSRPAPLPVHDVAPVTTSEAHDQARRAETAFYVGTSTTTSPDGTRPYGPKKKVAVRRTIDGDGLTIHEYVVHPGRELPTTLVRRAGTTTFEATDEAKSFAGTLAFSGADLNAWTYEIRMTDGSGRLTGEGRRTARAITTTKTFYGADGAAKARIVEELERVDEGAFEAAREELLAAPAK